MGPEPFRIEPTFSPRLWGSKSLAPIYPEKTNLTEPIGEAWLTDVNCRIATGPFAEKTLAEAWREMPAEWRGSDFAKPGDFPLLVKFIFPMDKLSIQVHPDDTYASVHEKPAGGRGKTEMWHVVSAKPGASLLLGLKPGVTKESFLAALANHTLEDLFQRYTVQAGDTFFIPARTPHTIGADMIICEVQQYSDLTYRVYDYGRLDPSGKPRELHIEKAMNVMNFQTSQNVKTRPLTFKSKDRGLTEVGPSLLAACKYFATAKYEISKPLPMSNDPDAFFLFVFLSGSGQIVWNENSSTFHPGECWFIPAGLKEYSVVPRDSVVFLSAYVPCLPSLEEEWEDFAGFSPEEISKVVFD